MDLDLVHEVAEKIMLAQKGCALIVYSTDFNRYGEYIISIKDCCHTAFRRLEEEIYKIENCWVRIEITHGEFTITIGRD